MTEVIASNQLKSFVSRIEKLEQDKADIANDIKEIYDEAKATGFDIKTIKELIKLKKIDSNKLAEQEALLTLYREALDI